VHYVILAIVLVSVILAIWAGGAGEPDLEMLERADATDVKEILEERVDELSDEEILELWKRLRKDMKRRERRGVIFSERLKLESEHPDEALEEFDEELQRELLALEKSSSD